MARVLFTICSLLVGSLIRPIVASSRPVDAVPCETTPDVAICQNSEIEALEEEESVAVKVEMLQSQGGTASASAVKVQHKQKGKHVKSQRSEGIDFGAALAEYFAMTLFVWIGCGCAMGIANDPGAAWILQTSLAFGFAITALAYAIGSYSGGQINCAVTFALMLVGELGISQGLANFVAQMLGSVTGALILDMMCPAEKDKTGGLGSNSVQAGYSQMNALVAEIMGTFLLLFVVLETAVNPNSVDNRSLACVAIGFAVFLAHVVMIPIDGCSINPTRSFGPAVVAKWRNDKLETFKQMWIFWAGPLSGAALAAGAYSALLQF